MIHDHTNLVSEIRQILSSGKVVPELLTEVAAEYGEACAEVNDRLAEVGKLLAGGYRDEALEAADRRPNLLFYTQLVDFPEREQWNAMLKRANVAVPARLLTDCAEQLEQAYEEQRQLAPLMRQHRLLALSRAPLAARLTVLRRLAEKDPGNPIWRDDVETFETARLVEIRDEVARACRKGELESLYALTEEVSGRWSIPLPKGLRQSVKDAWEKAKRIEARNKLAARVGDLNNALAAFDIERGRQLREEWNELAPVAALEESDPLLAQTREAFAWLIEADQQEDETLQFEGSLVALERAIDDQLPWDAFEPKLYAVEKFGREIPAAIARRAQQYREALHLGRSRRVRLRVALVSVAVVAVAVLLYYVVSRWTHQKELAEARTQLAAFVEPLDHDGADRFFKQLPPWIGRDGEIIRLWNDIAQRHEAISRTQENFNRLIERIDLGGPLDRDIDQLLKQARSLAETPEMKQRVTTIEGEVQNERLRRQKARGDAFLKELEPLAARLQTLEQTPLEATEVEAWETLQRDLAALKSRSSGEVDAFPAVASAMLRQLDPLSGRIQSRLDASKEYTASLKELDAIAQSVGDVPSFATKLREFGERRTKLPISAELLATMTERPSWDAFAGWRRLADEPAWDDLTAITGERAAALLADIDKLRPTPIANVLAELKPAEAFLKRLTEVGARDAELAATIDSLITKYERFDYTYQSITISPSGDFKYWRKEPTDVANGARRYYYFVDLTKVVKESEFELLEASELEAHKFGRVGIAALATPLVKLLKNAPPSQRDPWLGEVLALALSEPQTETPIDSIVQAVLVEEILKLAAAHGLHWGDFATQNLKAMEKFELPMIDWMEFKNPVTSRVRKQLAALLSEIRARYQAALPAVRVAMEQKSPAGDWRRAVDYQWVGWIYNLDDSWRVGSPAALEGEPELYVLLTARAGEAPLFQLAGKAVDGRLAGAPQGAVLKSGRPVFTPKKP